MRFTPNKNEQKKLGLICLFLLALIPLFAQNDTKLNPPKKFITQTQVSISPLLSPRLCLGIVKTKQAKDNHWIEYSYNIHGFYSVGFKNYGVAATYKYFWSESRKGYFTQLIAGIDYVDFSGFPMPMNSGGSGGEGFTPNISGGFGYSFQIGKKSYFRLSMDIGYKWFLSNTYISFVW